MKRLIGTLAVRDALYRCVSPAEFLFLIRLFYTLLLCILSFVWIAH